MAERGIALCPTLSFFHAVATEGSEAGVPLEYVEKARRMAEASFRALRFARQAGVRIVAGTDSGAPLTPHSSIRGDLRLLVEGGYSPAEAIVAGPASAAAALGWQDQIGTLEPGKAADFIVVRGNPL